MLLVNLLPMSLVAHEGEFTRSPESFCGRTGSPACPNVGATRWVALRMSFLP
jgi:hypothetical protein